MLRYFFPPRFTDQLRAGLQPGPWRPGMKRQSLLTPRRPLYEHAAPGEPVELMATPTPWDGFPGPNVYSIGVVVVTLRVPVLLTGDGSFTFLLKRKSPSLSEDIGDDLSSASAIVAHYARRRGDWMIEREEMEAFAQAEGFTDALALQQHWRAPADDAIGWGRPLVLIGWRPRLHISTPARAA